MSAVIPMVLDTATDRVRSRLKSEIIAGDYRSGERLKIADIAARYGISPIPVREALRLLAGEGLVEMLPHRGAIVRKVDDLYVANMYDIRMALEAMLVERAIERLKPADLKRISQACDAYTRAAQRLDVRSMLDANASYHGAVNAVAANDEATQVLQRGWELIRGMRLRFGFTAERAQENVEQHEALLAAIADRNVSLAVKITRNHCASGRDDLLQYLQTQPLASVAT